MKRTTVKSIIDKQTKKKKIIKDKIIKEDKDKFTEVYRDYLNKETRSSARVFLKSLSNEELILISDYLGINYTRRAKVIKLVLKKRVGTW